MPSEHVVVSRHARVLIEGDRDLARETWLIFHGHGMLARGMLHWFKPARNAERLLVAPEALSRFYTELSGGRKAVGASWLTREDLELDLQDLYGYFERFESFLPPGLPLQVHGFSQGVSVAVRWAVRTNRQVSRLVCWAGTLPEDVPLDQLKRHTHAHPILLVVGDRDTRVAPERVELDVARLREAGVPVELRRFAGGHSVDAGVLAQLSAPAA